MVGLTVSGYLPELGKGGMKEAILLPKRTLSNIGVRFLRLELHVGVGNLWDR